MAPSIHKIDLPSIAHLRAQFLAENNIQFILDKAHLYGWADTYAFESDGDLIGYGSVWGKDDRKARDTIFEFYVVDSHSKFSARLFTELIRVSGAEFIEAQANDLFMAPMLYAFARDIFAEAVLFEDGEATTLESDAKLVHLNHDDKKSVDQQYALMVGEEQVGSGGLMLNYNHPYADIYYEVEEQHRRKGYGSFLVQELKRAAYEMNRVPAARCNIKNELSKATMIKAGLRVCGWRLQGRVKNE